MNLKDKIYRLTHWETWHYLVKYIPIMPVWLWYCARARSFWFFTPSNPTLTFGGFEGESKKEMYDQLPPGSYPKSMYVLPSLPTNELIKQINENGYSFPIAVKPDVGMMGFMFRKIGSAEELYAYHKVMQAEYIVQELITLPLEVSVFYYRIPGERNGTISGFLKKEFLEVIGDGESTLTMLIANYERVRFRLEEMRSKHADRLNDIIPAGEIYKLSYALNLSRGGRLISLAHEIDDRLRKVFDELSDYTKHFYYGRYDIKCSSIEALKKGEFSILEFNGSGAEPHHAYGNGNTLLQAYAIFLHHWNVLFKISAINKRKGIKQWDYNKGRKFLKDAKKYFKVLKQLDIATRTD